MKPSGADLWKLAISHEVEGVKFPEWEGVPENVQRWWNALADDVWRLWGDRRRPTKLRPRLTVQHGSFRSIRFLTVDEVFRKVNAAELPLLMETPEQKAEISRILNGEHNE
jgi:hypothetical protein